MLGRHVVVLAVLGGTVLGGCANDSPEPRKTLASSSPDASVSESPGEAAPESPTAFLPRWVAASNEMQNSGEINDYLQMSKGCGSCRDVAERVEAAFSAGGFFRTRGWRVLDITDRTTDDARPILDLRVDSAPTTLRESAGGQLVRYPGGDFTYRFRLMSDGSGSWTVRRLTQVPS